MDKILHDPKDPKLWELWYIPHYGSCRILSISRITDHADSSTRVLRGGGGVLVEFRIGPSTSYMVDFGEDGRQRRHPDLPISLDYGISLKL